jgi:hypothetical protein
MPYVCQAKSAAQFQRMRLAAVLQPFLYFLSEMMISATLRGHNQKLGYQRTIWPNVCGPNCESDESVSGDAVRGIPRRGNPG